MIAVILISAGLAYFLSLPFASVLQGGGYRLSALLRAKRALVSCAVYFAVSTTVESIVLYFTDGLVAFAITAVLYLFTGAFVLYIHRKMRIAMHFTRRLIRLLIAFVLLYILLFIGLTFLSMSGLWATTPVIAPFLLMATACILSPFEKRNNRRYVQKAAARFADCSATKIGVTGSYGKTGVKHYLEKLLSVSYVTLVTPENYNTPLGIAKTVGEMTGKEEMLVLEMGARRRGDIAELCDIVCPDIGVITGIAPQHLETFHSIEEIMKEKNVLAERVVKEKTVFYNLTDPLVRKLYEEREGKKLGVGYKDAEYIISEEHFDNEGSSFVLSDGERCIKVKLPAVGKSCVVNFALAAAVSIECGILWESVAEIARESYAPAHRFEIVKRGDVTVIDDSYNINPIGAAAALDSLAAFAGERKVVYTSGIVELGEQEERYNRELGEHLAKVADLAIVCEGRYGDAIVRGIGNKTKVIRVRDTREASALFGRVLGKGDVLLIMSDLPRDYLL